jgi:hypothetical protein
VSVIGVLLVGTQPGNICFPFYLRDPPPSMCSHRQTELHKSFDYRMHLTALYDQSPAACSSYGHLAVVSNSPLRKLKRPGSSIANRSLFDADVFPILVPYSYVCVYIYICMYVCMCIYIYECVHMYVCI